MNYVDMTHQQRSILNYLRDMFSSTFDEELIEAVLQQRDWNSKYSENCYYNFFYFNKFVTCKL